MPFDRNRTPIAGDLKLITVSVSTVASASVPTGYRGLFLITSCSMTIVTPGGTSVPLDNLAKNSFIWMEIAFVSVIATATSAYGII